MKLSKKLLIICFLSFQAVAGVKWGYQGKIAPEHWGNLTKDFQSCSIGQLQTPINITNVVKQKDLPRLNFNYVSNLESMVNNGHTVQINMLDKRNYLQYGETKYYLKQFHFHTTSENLIEGKSYPLEAHFVHVSKEGKLLVVGLMFDYGDTNIELEKAWRQFTSEENKSIKLKDSIKVAKLLPKDKSYYQFEGSLTTPPCSEGVIWIVLKQANTVSEKQVKTFARLMKHPNNRPVQPHNKRIIKSN